ncbi:MAG: hypothetical protein AAF806_27960 [Bacteroidota bacterium]
MRINVLIAVLSLCYLSLSAQTDDKAAIIKVIEDEHRFFCEKNFEKMAMTFDQTENLLWGDGIEWSIKGWETIAKGFQDYFANDPEPIEPDIFYNYDITIGNDRAIAVFDHKKKDKEKSTAKGVRILVKRDGAWKITALSFLGLQ